VDLGSDEVAVQALAIDNRLVLAGTEADGVLRSDDAGDSWRSIDSLSGQGVTALAFSPQGILAAATEAGVAISTDRGASWRMSGADLGPVLCLAFLADGALLAGLADQGLARTDDGGATWSLVSDLRARLLVGLVASGDALVAGDLQSGIVVSRDGGRGWQAIETPGVHVMARSSAGGLFAATEGGLLRSADGGATWQAVEGAPRQPPRALGAANSIAVAWSDGTLGISDDDGVTWRAIQSPGGEVVSLALSNEGVLLAATSDVTVWRFAAGAWQRWLVRPAPSDVVPIAVPPAHAIDGSLYVGLAGRVWRPSRRAEEVRGGERRPLWDSDMLADGLLRVTALGAVDRTVVAGTSGGVFLSRDAGAHFEAWSEGLSPPAIVALAYSDPEQVYALGLGGTVWRRSVR
jgi:hypothetical protein